VLDWASFRPKYGIETESYLIPRAAL
jgi:hypothetical protein